MSGRSFEVVTRYQDQGITLPQRKTRHAAGYDFAAAEDFVVPSIWRLNFVKIFRKLNNGHELMATDYRKVEHILRPVLVPTGIKVKMPTDEVLLLINRSSSTLRRFLSLPNGVGVIDADYYNNDDNEGEIYFQLLNFGLRDQKIHKGDRLGQGIFIHYLTVDHEVNTGQVRQGGFGSSGR